LLRGIPVPESLTEISNWRSSVFFELTVSSPLASFMASIPFSMRFIKIAAAVRDPL
jgi:hypothetical protein